MFKTFTITYNDQKCDDFGLKCKKRPNIPRGKERVERFNVAGRDGSLHRRYGTYEDIPIPINFNFIEKNRDRWHEAYRRAMKWIKRPTGELIFSDDQQFYRKVKDIEVEDSERTTREIGNLTIYFLCDAYYYLIDGSREIILENEIFNAYDRSAPIYRIVGEGFLTLRRNGREIRVNVGQEVTINTDLRLCYRDGNMQNTSMQGDYTDLFLEEGENHFSWSEGFKIYITPQWRVR